MGSKVTWIGFGLLAFVCAAHQPEAQRGAPGGAVTLNEQSGELLQPVIREGRKNPGLPSMPAIDLPSDDVRAIAEYIHSILAMGHVW